MFGGHGRLHFADITELRCPKLPLPQMGAQLSLFKRTLSEIALHIIKLRHESQETKIDLIYPQYKIYSMIEYIMTFGHLKRIIIICSQCIENQLYKYLIKSNKYLYKIFAMHTRSMLGVLIVIGIQSIEKFEKSF